MLGDCWGYRDGLDINNNYCLREEKGGFLFLFMGYFSFVIWGEEFYRLFKFFIFIVFGV